MNLQTEALAKQAAEYAIEFATQDQELYIPKLMEKFAELIVKECVGVVEGGSFLHDQAPTAIFARECSGAIKRHFGVEE